jgi:PKD repeat protein
MKNSSVPVLLILFCFSCSKPYPVVELERPVFYFNGNINNVSRSLAAGIGDYYMTTSYSDMQSVGSHMYVFKGKLMIPGCNNCEDLQIEFFDSSIRTESSVASLPNILPSGVYDYLHNDSLSSSITYQFKGVGGYSTYNWSFGDGTNSSLQNPIHQFPSSTTYNVCLTAADSVSGCSITSCNSIYVSESPEYDLVFSYELQQQDLLVLTAAAGWTPLEWKLNDSLISSGFLAVASLSPNSSNAIKVCLTASKNNITKTFCRMLKIDSYTTCSADWLYQSSIDSNSITDFFSKIRISYTSPSGVKYISDKYQQPSSSYFNVLEKADYINNENNQSTKKLRCAFNATLYRSDNSSDSIHISTNDCWWGVALP